MSQQETGLTFDVLILSWIQQSSSESKRTDVAVIHRGTGAPATKYGSDHNWFGRLGLLFFFSLLTQMLKFEDINESLAQIQFNAKVAKLLSAFENVKMKEKN